MEADPNYIAFFIFYLVSGLMMAVSIFINMLWWEGEEKRIKIMEAPFKRKIFVFVIIFLFWLPVIFLPFESTVKFLRSISP